MWLTESSTLQTFIQLLLELSKLAKPLGKGKQIVQQIF